MSTYYLTCGAQSRLLYSTPSYVPCWVFWLRVLHRVQDVVFPLYNQVKAEHVVPGMRALLAQLHKDIDALEASVTPSWEGLVEPLEKLTDRHQRVWGIVSHLKVS